jgi:hypothetical protein
MVDKYTYLFSQTTRMCATRVCECVSASVYVHVGVGKRMCVCECIGMCTRESIFLFRISLNYLLLLIYRSFSSNFTSVNLNLWN